MYLPDIYNLSASCRENSTVTFLCQQWDFSCGVWCGLYSVVNNVINDVVNSLCYDKCKLKPRKAFSHLRI